MGLKSAIEGRIRALANVHSLFAETRWIGAELSNIVTQELAPYSEKAEKRVRIDGPQVLLEPNAAQAIAVTLHELATNAAILVVSLPSSLSRQRLIGEGKKVSVARGPR